MDSPSLQNTRWSPAAFRRIAALLGFSVVVIVADQVTKAAIRASLHPGETWPEGWELIRLSHVHNTGAAFGILQGAGTFLVVAPFLATAAITVFLLTLPTHSRWYSIALAAILGGAVGNLIDRIRLGHVTDFIDPTHYPSFNLADSAIVLGVLTIVVLSFFAPVEGGASDGEPAASPEGASDDVRQEART